MSAPRRSSHAKRDEGGRITIIEVVSFTAVLAFVAAVASGVFDSMLTWK